MLKTRVINRIITNDEVIFLNGVTSARVYTNLENNQRVFVNEIEVISNPMDIIIPDGTSSNVELNFSFKNGNLPTSIERKNIVLQYKKIV